ncbi:MAG: cyclodeaminase/cyclohydrolase family protein [Clostridiales bacterium]|nr:cyclodeaminase/cyclohydrolase family protein [Clostridiales bacterium]
MLKDMGLKEFINQTASKEPVPGGGSIAALSGLLGAALAEMVANLTIGKKNYLEVEDEIKEIQSKFETLRFEFLDMIDEDAESFDLVMQAFKMPKETDEDKLVRTQKIQEGLKIAALSPLNIARKSFEMIDICEVVVKKGNKNAVTDGMVAAMMARTSVLSAILNVRINLSSIKDEGFVEEITEEIDRMEKEIFVKEERILKSVEF